MPNQLREGIEKKKHEYIQRLLSVGIYRQADRQLYELTLTELKQTYKETLNRNGA
jgi:hypothetical protein